MDQLKNSAFLSFFLQLNNKVKHGHSTLELDCWLASLRPLRSSWERSNWLQILPESYRYRILSLGVEFWLLQGSGGRDTWGGRYGGLRVERAVEAQLRSRVWLTPSASECKHQTHIRDCLSEGLSNWQGELRYIEVHSPPPEPCRNLRVLVVLSRCKKKSDGRRLGSCVEEFRRSHPDEEVQVTSDTRVHRKCWMRLDNKRKLVRCSFPCHLEVVFHFPHALWVVHGFSLVDQCGQDNLFSYSFVFLDACVYPVLLFVIYRRLLMALPRSSPLQPNQHQPASATRQPRISAQYERLGLEL